MPDLERNVPRDRPMSLDEWCDLPEDEAGELVSGRLVPEEMPTHVHELLVAVFIAALRNWGKPRGALVLGSETKQRVDDAHGRKPDLVVYLAGAPRPRGRASSSAVPPSLVVEVITRTPRDERRDRVEKPDEYAHFGVRWYWLVDPEARTLEIFELAGDRYGAALAATGGTVAIPGCDGLTIDLDDLWREVDELLADDAPQTP